jgi:hypothetical protein
MSDAAITADRPLTSRSGRLLSLVRRLWDYGRQVSASLRQNPPATAGDNAHLVRTFGISNVVAILTRIALGMHRARFLEGKISSAAAQIDAGAQPEPAPSTRAPRACPGDSRPCAPGPAPELSLTEQTIALIVRLPTVDQIARKVHTQPIGAILADICRDLGISRGHPLWDELQAAIIEFGGSVVGIVRSRLNRLFPLARIVDRLKGAPADPPKRDSTGPPLLAPA